MINIDIDYIMAQSTAQANKSQAITLKGSAELIGEFFGELCYYNYILLLFYPAVFLTFVLRGVSLAKLTRFPEFCYFVL